MDRRSFLKRTTTGLAAAGLLKPFAAAADTGEADASPPARIALFHDPGFPTVDGCVTAAVLHEALGGMDVQRLDAQSLRTRLTPAAFDILVMAHGSAFPLSASDTVHAFLAAGGSWVQLGGVPLARPVRRRRGAWRVDDATVVHHRRLGITQSDTVDVTSIMQATVDPLLPQGHDGAWNPIRVFPLQCILTEGRHFPDEDGSDGPRHALIRPLVSLAGPDARSLAAPVVLIDRIAGHFEGGRWVIAGYEGAMSPSCLRALLRIATDSPIDARIAPTYACHHAGETPGVHVTASLHGRRALSQSGDAHITVTDEAGRVLWTHAVSLARRRQPGRVMFEASVALPATLAAQLAPGYHEVDCRIDLRQPDADTRVTRCTTGFWMEDAVLFASGSPVRMGHDMFERDGAPFLVTGTTYMAGDVHRRFLLDPNPAVWMRDMAAMTAAGVTMLRTGIWTGWRLHAANNGQPHEAVLRALEAFILTCRRHDLPLIFTFFSFLPEAFGGDNAFLDPRAVEGQSRFVRGIVERCRTAPTLLWDFINEPSFCSPKKLWQCRPNGDRHEVAAWNAWLARRHPAESDQERAEDIGTSWGCLTSLPATLPDEADFNDANLLCRRHPFKALDYRLFAQHAFTAWAATMAAIVRRHGHPEQTVTVGQDEGGTLERPSPQFHADAVDFTCVHNWWFNTDLVWDSVMTGVPGKPHLVEETGAMMYETMDGMPWRSGEEVSALVERKFMISAFVNGSGFVQWCWNTNVYMDSDNEAAIGFLRADGSAKPELHAFMRFAAFAARIAPHLRGARRDDVLMVIPHANMFATRSTAMEATRRAVRTMWHDCGIPMAAISEYRVAALTESPRLFIVPAPRLINAAAWEALLGFVSRGAALLLTGPLDRDDHGRPARLLEMAGLTASTARVGAMEELHIGGVRHLLPYTGEKVHRIERGVDGPVALVRSVSHGGGRIIWSPLPVELSDATEPTTALYRLALKEAGIEPAFRITPAVPILVIPHSHDGAMLYALVSESAEDADIELTDAATGSTHSIRVPARRTACVIIDRTTGAELARLG